MCEKRKRGGEREIVWEKLLPSLLASLGAGQSTGGGASAQQTQKREKKPKMTDAEVVAHLSKQHTHHVV